MGIKSGVATNLAVNREIRGNNGQAAGHGFDQRMSKGLSVCRSYVDVSAPIKLMQPGIRHCTQLDHGFRESKSIEQTRSSIRTIAAGILARSEFAGQQQFDPPGHSITNKRQGSEKGLEIPVIVVVADEEELQASVCVPQFLFDVLRQGRRVAREILGVEAMMDRADV